jgi:hypothetical protein
LRHHAKGLEKRDHGAGAENAQINLRLTTMFRISCTEIKLIAVIAGAKRIRYRSIEAIRGAKVGPGGKVSNRAVIESPQTGAGYCFPAWASIYSILVFVH